MQVGFFSCQRLVWSLLVIVLADECVLAQPQGNVTVQLPTFHQFGVSTTVVVPDRGSVYLGGVNRSSLGRTGFAPGVPGLGNRGIGRNTAGAGLSISATIIDHDEIDRALLAEAARRRGATTDIRGRAVDTAPQLPLAASTHRAAARARDGRNALAPPPYRRAITSGVASPTAQAETYRRRAERAEANGQLRHAIVFYRRVAKHGSPAEKQTAKQRIAELEQALNRPRD